MELTEFERINILIMKGCGDKQRSYREVADLFNAKFRRPNRLAISKSTVHSTVRRFEETGSLKARPRSGRPVSATDEETSVNVLLTLVEDPRCSFRKIASQHDISTSSVVNILRRHPYNTRSSEQTVRACIVKKEDTTSGTNGNVQFPPNSVAKEETTREEQDLKVFDIKQEELSLDDYPGSGDEEETSGEQDQPVLSIKQEELQVDDCPVPGAQEQTRTTWGLSQTVNATEIAVKEEAQESPFETVYCQDATSTEMFKEEVRNEPDTFDSSEKTNLQLSESRSGKKRGLKSEGPDTVNRKQRKTRT